ncbi:hypothetical protein SUGI_0646060 [Cryptomeria japonica]|nr:hypothetical protein SUGI_0646060 [Cryptomeria japonica]
MEVVKFEVNLVLLPLNEDQGINTRLAAGELEVGVEVERQEDGNFIDELIQTVVLKVMNEKCQRRELKSKMSEMKRKIFGEGESEDRCIQEFIEHIRMWTSGQLGLI